MTAQRIAMWSGPRNLSTALMYAFAQRSDCAVWDEPFYAAYLQMTGLDHPMRDDIIADGLTDPAQVIARCLEQPKPLFYQKHMTQHMIDGVDRDWIMEVTNVFLIRHPARVIASYDVKRENPTLEDIGFQQQYDLFQMLRDRGQTPLVVDSADIRDAPETTLTRLCSALNIPFDPAMLRWPAGGNAADGIWAKHWYGAVHRSTGFAGSEGPLPQLSGALAQVCDAALTIYEELKRHAL